MLEELVTEWARCRRWLDAALHRGGDTQTLDDVFARVYDGTYQFWPTPDAAVVTQIIPGRDKEFNIYLAGGSMARLEHMMPVLERYAQSQDCTIVTVLGRRGWERSFLCQKLGYKPVATLYGKDLRKEATTG
jgi:hypothetical protein